MDTEYRNKKSKKTTDTKLRKTGRIMLRALILAVVFCIVIFGGVALSDMFFSDDTKGTTPEIIAVTVSAKDIILNDDRKVTLSELRTYLADAQEKDELFTVALINDTNNPADYETYNRIVELLAEFDIICEKMEVPSTYDELHLSTIDQIPVT